MDAPTTLLGWLNAAGLLWTVIAYGFAVVAGVRALSCAYRADHAPPPACLIADTTRWLFNRPLSERQWRGRDFMAVGVFGATLASASFCALNLHYLLDLGWRTLGGAEESLAWTFTHVASASSLIILHCGVALRFSKIKADGVQRDEQSA